MSKKTKKHFESIAYLKQMKDIHNYEDYKLVTFEIYWSSNTALVEREIERKRTSESSDLVKYLNTEWTIFKIGPRGGITKIH